LSLIHPAGDGNARLAQHMRDLRLRKREASYSNDTWFFDRRRENCASRGVRELAEMAQLLFCQR